MDIELKKLHIQNYRSLRDVELTFKRLTVLAGANASGKSNILDAMRFISHMVKKSSGITETFLPSVAWPGKSNSISFELEMLANTTPLNYQFTLSTKPLIIKHDRGNDTTVNVLDEELTINHKQIIKTVNGVGTVRDENNFNQESSYNPSVPKLALQSAGDYGYKPITRSVHQFTQSWMFYDFKPSDIRSTDYEYWDDSWNDAKLLNQNGSISNFILLNWSKTSKEKFDNVNNSLSDLIGLTLQTQQVTSSSWTLHLHEGYEKLIPFNQASDGTLRLIAYLILLNQDELPPLIAIEEPERSLHPALLYKLAYLLEQLSRRTQVVITTHSLQLLDALEPDLMGDDLEVLLLKNVYGEGTQVFNLEEMRQNQVALRGWIEDFGIGSAIFESNLIDELEVEYV